MQLSKVIFWDTDYNKIDWEQKARFVISRVVMYGTIEDWTAIKSFYGLERIKTEMLQERYLDNKSLSFLSFIFDIPREEFRCFIEKMAFHAHWNL